MENRGKFLTHHRSWPGFCFMILLVSSSHAFAYTLPEPRVVTWQGNAGAFTDWSASRTTICSTLSPSGGNDATQITSALNSCPSGQVVKLNAGTFLISSTINWPKDSVSLRGSGSTQTILKIQSGLSAGTVFNFANSDYYWTANTNHVVSSGYTKGSTQITTATSHGWAVGDFVLIDQANDTTGPPMFDTTGYDGSCTWCSRDRGNGTNRFFGQVVKISAIVNATTASFTPPLYQTYNPSFDLRAVKAAASFRRGISIENLKVDNAGYFAKYIVDSLGLLDSVISGIEIDGLDDSSNSSMFRFRCTAFLTVKDSYWHNTQGNSSSANYGLWFMFGCSANLVVNNAIYDVYLPFATEGGPNSGSVFAYNYSLKPKFSPGYTGYTPAYHYNLASMMLLEGNQIEKASIRLDTATGSSLISGTFLRNRVTNDTTNSNARQNFTAEHGNYYENLVGNVIGTAGVETKYECYNTASNCSDSTPVIYRLGYNDPFNESAPYDTAVKTTMLRHYNWDSVTNGTKLCSDSGEPGCQGGPADTAIPTSLLYSSRPSWWCTETPWPPIGPDVSGLSNDIPAKRRYLGQPCTAAGSTPSAPAAPTNFRIAP